MGWERVRLHTRQHFIPQLSVSQLFCPSPSPCTAAKWKLWPPSPVPSSALELHLSSLQPSQQLPPTPSQKPQESTLPKQAACRGIVS